MLCLLHSLIVPSSPPMGYLVGNLGAVPATCFYPARRQARCHRREQSKSRWDKSSGSKVRAGEDTDLPQSGILNSSFVMCARERLVRTGRAAMGCRAVAFPELLSGSDHSRTLTPTNGLRGKKHVEHGCESSWFLADCHYSGRGDSCQPGGSNHAVAQCAADHPGHIGRHSAQGANTDAGSCRVPSARVSDEACSAASCRQDGGRLDGATETIAQAPAGRRHFSWMAKRLGERTAQI